MRQKLELMKQIHFFKKGFVILLKGATFSVFIDTINLQALGYLNPVSAILENFFFN